MPMGTLFPSIICQWSILVKRHECIQERMITPMCVSLPCLAPNDLLFVLDCTSIIPFGLHLVVLWSASYVRNYPWATYKVSIIAGYVSNSIVTLIIVVKVYHSISQFEAIHRLCNPKYLIVLEVCIIIDLNVHAIHVVLIYTMNIFFSPYLHPYILS